MSDNIRVCYVSREDGKVFCVPETITFNRHNNPLSTMFRCDTRLIDLIHCIMNYVVTFQLHHDEQFLEAQTFYIAHDMQFFKLIQDASLSMGCGYSGISKLFLKDNNALTFVDEQNQQGNGDHDLSLFHLGRAILFSSNKGNSGMLIMAPDRHINNPSLSASFHFYSYRFGKRVMAAYHDLHDHGNRRKGVHGAEPATFEELLNFTFKNTATPMSKYLTVLRLYLNDMCLFS